MTIRQLAETASSSTNTAAPPGLARSMATALGLATAPAVSLGLGRFAYALVLPAMRTSLHWSLATAGALTTANAVGYLAGALAAPSVAARRGERTALIGSLTAIVLSLAATAAFADLAYLLVVRLVAGTAGAIALIVGGTLAARLGAGAAPGRSALLLGVYFAGGGLGVAVSGAAVPLVMGSSAEGSWRTAWLVLAALSLAAVPACLPGSARSAPPAGHRGARPGLRWPARPLLALLVSYGLFGAGYIAYMTFIVAHLRGHGAGNGLITTFWIALGSAAVVAGFAWGGVLGRLRGGRGSALLMAVTAVAATLPLLSSNALVSYGSALLFGSAFLSVITAVTTCARDSLPERCWTAAIAGLTTVFALGQCLGPLLAGTLSDGPSGTTAGLAIGAVLLAVAAVTALAQRTLVPSGAAVPTDTVPG
ncbi:YbfB/YjiJ family MFS transporter [Kitasatospora sp. GP82]|uniref:YbfB/YjiJ family MFS transporter n=1 Tax=Kitasatospora sp. GP82 TaxID=3035089 RepID=UPI0024764012|nr:YbfB/YjiJ family MFS transporter [Kitasatospora sp. GP82]MDH6129544.1 putative MFS family arabinose efflux permease [Kitasatospora sp. GP82]